MKRSTLTIGVGALTADMIPAEIAAVETAAAEAVGIEPVADEAADVFNRSLRSRGQ